MTNLMRLTNDFTRPLDLARIAWLRFALRSAFVRSVYVNRSQRLAMNFTLLSAIYLLLSLKLTIFLLVLGPILLGYPHLIASYRFLQRPLEKTNLFGLFLLVTLISLLIRFFAIPKTLLPELPYGSYEIVISLFSFAFLKIPNQWPVKLMTFITVAILLRFAWMNPLLYVGLALVLHNWVAFAHWIIATRNKKDLWVAIGGTILFSAVHALVFYGVLDSWITFSKDIFISAESFEVKGWILAPWTNNAMVWNRVLVLYAFGLSMHYFVWLQAIPQCLDQNQVPNSFRRTIELIKSDCGSRTTFLLFAGGIAFIGIWIFTSYAGRIYFGVAMLHGWLELVFLVATISSVFASAFRHLIFGPGARQNILFRN